MESLEIIMGFKEIKIISKVVQTLFLEDGTRYKEVIMESSVIKTQPSEIAITFGVLLIKFKEMRMVLKEMPTLQLEIKILSKEILIKLKVI